MMLSNQQESRLDWIAASYGGSTSWPIYACDQAIANNTMTANPTASSVATAAHHRTSRARATSRRNLSMQAAQRASRACCLASTAPMRRSVSASTLAQPDSASAMSLRSPSA